VPLLTAILYTRAAREGTLRPRQCALCTLVGWSLVACSDTAQLLLTSSQSSALPPSSAPVLAPPAASVHAGCLGWQRPSTAQASAQIPLPSTQAPNHLPCPLQPSHQHWHRLHQLSLCTLVGSWHVAGQPHSTQISADVVININSREHCKFPLGRARHRLQLHKLPVICLAPFSHISSGPAPSSCCIRGCGCPAWLLHCHERGTPCCGRQLL
jgi:hypothetical protein